MLLYVVKESNHKNHGKLFQHVRSEKKVFELENNMISNLYFNASQTMHNHERRRKCVGVQSLAMQRFGFYMKNISRLWTHCLHFASVEPWSSASIHPVQFSQTESTMPFLFCSPWQNKAHFCLVLPARLSPAHTGRVAVLQSRVHSSILPLGLDPESPPEHAEP